MATNYTKVQFNKTGYSKAVAGETNYLLLQTGKHLFLQDGFKIILESGSNIAKASNYSKVGVSATNYS